MIDSFDAQKASSNEHEGYAIKACYADSAQDRSGSCGACSSVFMLQV